GAASRPATGPTAARTPAPRRTAQVPQNPNRGPNPAPAPPKPPIPEWTPTPFDPKDPSIPTYTLPPLR
ncbi:hypothetical protein ACWGVR_38615, partial [Streptomyces xanthophaeus]